MSKTTQPNLSNRLLRYSATASLVASGVMAASSQPAEAATIITYGGEDATIENYGSLDINLDGDPGGDPDFTIWVTNSNYSGAAIFIGNIDSDVRFVSQRSNIYFMPYALASSYSIAAVPALTSSASPWMKIGTRLGTLTMGDNYGFWTDMDNETAFLGMSFDADGETGGRHAAWVELTVTTQSHGGPKVTVNRIAWNDEAGQSILAGATPNAVDVHALHAVGGVQGILAGAFAALGGALTWLRRKLGK